MREPPQRNDASVEERVRPQRRAEPRTSPGAVHVRRRPDRHDVWDEADGIPEQLRGVPFS